MEGVLKLTGLQALPQVGLATRFISAMEVWGTGSACHKCKGGKESKESRRRGGPRVFSWPRGGLEPQKPGGVRAGGGRDSEGTAQPS